MTKTPKALTTAQIDAKIEAVREDMQRIESRQIAITTAIADAWGQDTSALEAEYAGHSAKLAAAQIVLQRLNEQRQEAERDDLTHDLEKIVRAKHQAAVQLQNSDDALQAAYQALLAGPLAAYQDARQEYMRLVSGSQHITELCRRAGVNPDQFNMKYPDVGGETQAIRELVNLLENGLKRQVFVVRPA